MREKKFLVRAARVLLACVLSVLFLHAQAQPQPQSQPARRMALVMGNDGYQHVSKLQKAGNDASAMARELKAAGFNVVLQKDLGYRAMVKAVETFSGSVRSGDQVVVFFAGHGVQIRAGSYLLPVDIEAASEAEIEKTAYGLNDLTEKLADAKAAFTLVVVDACRDNPLRTNNGRSVGGTRGLAAIEPPRGQMVVYSASRGQQALDRLSDKDTNPNGVFTREFIARMRQPGVRVEDMVRDVQDSVETLARTINHDQRPAIYNEARGSFYFFAPVVAPAGTQPQSPQSQAVQVAMARPEAPTAVPASMAAPEVSPDSLAGLRKAASGGDVVAMLELGDRLTAGNGAAKNPREAQNWYMKAAAEGNVVAEFKTSDSYRLGTEDYARDVVKILALPVENLRTVSAAGKESVARLVQADPFFDAPAGSGKASFSYKSPIGDHMQFFGHHTLETQPHEVGCTRNGRLSQIEYRHLGYGGTEFKRQGTSLLGGLLPLEDKTSTGMLSSYVTELTQVDSVYGQPFPLTPGKRFGMNFKRRNDFARRQYNYPASMSCTAEAPVAEGMPLLCLYRHDEARSRYFLARYVWSESTGCFVQTYESAGNFN
ncbi:caspase family protein [Variovorax terrae]|uniref:Caspase family protein n=1 Tax=Variovorax terrae TaxID=2923278 RepID=A0A9X2ALP3_9BURK|nr:caspase family protein [Variovorax terrae]MCJ0762903.1 caspase family protein [Variovorax terrae]